MSMLFHSTRHLSRARPPLSTLRPRHSTLRLSRKAFQDDGGASVLVTSFEPYRQVAKLLSRFAVGFGRLMEDMMSYHHIQEATLTRATLDRKIHRDAQIRRQRLRTRERHGIRVVASNGRELMFLPSDSYRYPRSRSEGGTSRTRDASKDWTSRRRPQEHLRQLARDLSVTAPTVLVSMAPFVGYGFMVMGMLFPRLLLSRQFHTKGQRYEFAMEEYGQRARHYGRLSGVFWGSCMRSVPRLRRTGSREVAEDENGEGSDAGLPSYLEPFGYTGSDAAGPVFDRRAMRTLYRLTTSMNSGKRQGAALRCLTSGHLESLALSNNVLSALPFWLVPDAHVRNKLETLAEDVLMDDAALIEEMIGFDGPCEGMADDEVLDACWLRGLPVGRFANAGGSAGPGIRRREEDEVREMRVALSNHLGMMEVLMTECRGLPSHDDFRSSSEIRSGRALVRDDVLKLLVLHLPAIRFSMKI